MTGRIENNRAIVESGSKKVPIDKVEEFWLILANSPVEKERFLRGSETMINQYMLVLKKADQTRPDSNLVRKVFRAAVMHYQRMLFAEVGHFDKPRKIEEWNLLIKTAMTSRALRLENWKARTKPEQGDSLGLGNSLVQMGISTEKHSQASRELEDTTLTRYPVNESIDREVVERKKVLPVIAVSFLTKVVKSHIPNQERFAKLCENPKNASMIIRACILSLVAESVGLEMHPLAISANEEQMRLLTKTGLKPEFKTKFKQHLDLLADFCAVNSPGLVKERAIAMLEVYYEQALKSVADWVNHADLRRERMTFEENSPFYLKEKARFLSITLPMAILEPGVDYVFDKDRLAEAKKMGLPHLWNETNIVIGVGEEDGSVLPAEKSVSRMIGMLKNNGVDESHSVFGEVYAKLVKLRGLAATYGSYLDGGREHKIVGSLRKRLNEKGGELTKNEYAEGKSVEVVGFLYETNKARLAEIRRDLRTGKRMLDLGLIVNKFRHAVSDSQVREVYAGLEAKDKYFFWKRHQDHTLGKEVETKESLLARLCKFGAGRMFLEVGGIKADDLQDNLGKIKKAVAWLEGFSLKNKDELRQVNVRLFFEENKVDVLQYVGQHKERHDPNIGMGWARELMGYLDSPRVNTKHTYFFSLTNDQVRSYLRTLREYEAKLDSTKTDLDNSEALRLCEKFMQNDEMARVEVTVNQLPVPTVARVAEISESLVYKEHSGIDKKGIDKKHLKQLDEFLRRDFQQTDRKGLRLWYTTKTGSISSKDELILDVEEKINRASRVPTESFEESQISFVGLKNVLRNETKLTKKGVQEALEKFASKMIDNSKIDIAWAEEYKTMNWAAIAAGEKFMRGELDSAIAVINNALGRVKKSSRPIELTVAEVSLHRDFLSVLKDSPVALEISRPVTVRGYILGMSNRYNGTVLLEQIRVLENEFTGIARTIAEQKVYLEYNARIADRYSLHESIERKKEAMQAAKVEYFKYCVENGFRLRSQPARVNL